MSMLRPRPPGIGQRHFGHNSMPQLRQKHQTVLKVDRVEEHNASIGSTRRIRH